MIGEWNGGRGRGGHCAQWGPNTGTYTVDVVCVHLFCININLLYILCPFTLGIHCSSL